MANTISSARLQTFYIAYYGRAADPMGLSYWDSVAKSAAVNGNESILIQNLGAATQTEFVAVYGTNPSIATFLNAIYHNLFGRDISVVAGTGGVSELSYWVGQYNTLIANGTSVNAARSSMITYIVDGAQGADAASIAAKVSYATAFTAAIDTLAEITAFGDLNNTAGLTTARAAMQAVTDSTTLATQTAALPTTTATIVTNSQTFALAAGATSADEGSSATFTLTTSNVADGTVLPYTLSGTGVTSTDATGGLTGTATVMSNKATITVALAADLKTEGAETLKVALDNGQASATTVITDTSVNVAPSITSAATGTVAENAAITTAIYTAAATDAGDTVTYSLKAATGDVAALDINSATGVVTLKASADFESTQTSYSFTVVATDSAGAATEKAVVASVTNVNEAPTITSAATATDIAENGAAGATVYTATGSDVDASTTLTYSLGGTDAASFAIDASTGAVTIVAAANFEAKPSYAFTVIASDGALSSTAKDVTLAVTNVNEAPTITSSATATAIDENGTAGATVYTAVGADVDASTTLSYTLGGTDAASFDINSSTGAVTIKAAANYEAKTSYSFDVTASDGTLSSAATTVALAVTDVLDKPTTVADSASTADHTAVTISVLANDSSNASAVASITQGTNGTVVNNGTTVTYTPNKGILNGTDTFTYVAQDADGQLSAATTVSVTVNTVNTAPVITAGQAFSVTENVNTSGKRVGFVAATDEEGGTAQSWAIATGTGSTNFEINQFTGEITQSATASFDYETATSYTLSLTATDGAGLAATATNVTINVADANDIAPVVSSAATATVAENTTAATTVYQITTTDGDQAATNGTPVYSIGGTDAAKFSVNTSTGAVTFVAAPDFEVGTGSGTTTNDYSITVSATDGTNPSAAKAVTISVTNVNDVAPVITSAATATVAENTAITTAAYTVVATDGDAVPAGETAVARVYSVSGTDAALFDIDSSTGALTFKTLPNFEAPTDSGANNVYDVTVAATDGVTTAATQAVAITVTNVNEAPTAVADTATALSGQMTNILVLANDTDPDATPALKITSVTQPAQGGLVEIASDGLSVNFTSTPGFASATPVTFTYIATDTNGTGLPSPSAATVSVTVSTQLGGTTGADNLIGSTVAETLEGGAGNDTINGGGGADVIDAGADNDNVMFYGSENNMTGGTGNDTLRVASTMSTLYGVDLGVSQNQTYRYSDSDGDTVLHESNDLTSTSVAGFENLDASASTIALVIDNLVTGRTLVDASYGDNVSTTSIKTGSGNDSIQVGSHTSALTIYSSAGDDAINSYGTVAITIYGEDGIDTIIAKTAAGAVTIDGGTGNDIITGNTGADSLVGGTGDDTINTDNGNNTVDGGTGNDIITLGTGNDSVDGGAGNDQIKIATANLDGVDTIKGGADTDSIVMTDDAGVVDADFANVTSVEVLTASATFQLDATLGASAMAAGLTTVTFAGTDGGDSDTVTIGAGFTSALTVNLDTDTNIGNVIDATAYTGVLTVASALSNTDATNSTITGGTGSDIFQISVDANVTALVANVTKVETISFVDGATGTTNTATVSLVEGNATYTSTAVYETITIDGSALVADKLVASAVADSNAKIIIKGGGGADTITGSASTNFGDSIDGGSGSDSFLFATANLDLTDTITGGAGTNSIVMTDDAAVVDADFTKATSVQVLTSSAAIQVDATLGASAMAAGLTTVTFAGTDGGDSDTVTIGAGFTSALTVNLDTDANIGNVIDATAYTGVLTVASALSNTDSNNSTVTGGTGSDIFQISVESNATALVANVTKVETISFVDGATGTTNTATVSLVEGNATYTSTAVYETITIDGSALVADKLVASAVADSNAKIIIKGGGGADTITGSASTNFGDSIDGGSGSDSFLFATANLTLADTITGGAGTNSIVMTNDATVDDADFTKATSIQVLTSSADINLVATLGASAMAAGLTTVTFADTGGDDTVTVGAGFTNALTVNLDADGTNGNVISAAAYTGVLTVASTLANTDTVNSTITGGTGSDIFQISVASNATALVANVTKVETIKFTDGDSATVNTATVSLVEGNATYTSTAVYDTITIDAASLVSVTGGAADDKLVASAAAESNAKVNIYGAGGADTITGSASTNFGDSITGGAGADSFRFAAVADLTSADTIDGGAGTDIISFAALTLEASTNILDSAFTRVTSVATLNLATYDDTGDNSANAVTATVTLGALAQAAGIVTVNLSAADGNTVDAGANSADTYNFIVDASGYTTGITITTNHATDSAGNTMNVQVTGGSGNDSVTAGAADDAVTVSGGAGADTIALGAATVGTVTWNLGSHVVTGSTTSTNGDIVTGFTQGTDKLELLGGTLYSGVGGQVVLSSVGDSLSAAGDVVAIADGNETAELASLAVGTDASAYVIWVDLDTEMGASVFDVAGVISQTAVNAAVTQLQTLVTTTVASMNIIFAIDDGADTALFQFQEGTLDQGIQAGELTLIGILDTSTTLAHGDFT